MEEWQPRRIADGWRRSNSPRLALKGREKGMAKVKTIRDLSPYPGEILKD